MVDNIESIRKILEFDKFGEFYFISIMQRNKDGIKVASSHDSCRRIRTFYVFSLEEFDKIVPFIKEICDKISARCYIELNRKDIFKCQIECIKRLAECIEHHTTKSRTIMDSIVAEAPSRDKLWMIDADGYKPDNVTNIIEYIKNHNGTHYAVIPTVNGCHIITSRFDPRFFNESFKDCEIKRNAFTLLYYNDISSK